jgi:hypothetical protein
MSNVAPFCALEEDPKPFDWTAKRLEAALLLAENELTDKQVWTRIGVSRRTLQLWKNHPEFKAKVRAYTERIGSRMLGLAIAKRVKRVMWLDQRHAKLQRIIRERGASEEMKDIPGGTTGLLVRQVKGVGRADNFRLIYEYVLDAALLAEMRALEKAAAQELEHFVEIHQAQGPDGGPAEHPNEPYTSLSIEQQRASLLALINRLRDRAAAEGLGGTHQSAGLLAGPAGGDPSPDTGFGSKAGGAEADEIAAFLTDEDPDTLLAPG